MAEIIQKNLLYFLYKQEYMDIASKTGESTCAKEGRGHEDASALSE